MSAKKQVTLIATIALGASLSNSVNLIQDIVGPDKPFRLFGIDVPSSWTTANLAIYQKHADGTYKVVKDEYGNEMTLVANAGGCIRFANPSKFASLTDIKILSGSTAVPVNQAAERDLTLVLREI